jgi:hypothetical protein
MSGFGGLGREDDSDSCAPTDDHRDHHDYGHYGHDRTRDDGHDADDDHEHDALS